MYWNGTQAALAAAGALAAAYLLAVPRLPYRHAWLIKTLPIWLLAVVAATALEGTGRILVTVALLFCSGGDLALAAERARRSGRDGEAAGESDHPPRPRRSVDGFVLGLGLFLVGHLFYIAEFSRGWTWQPWLAGVVALVAVGAVGVIRAMWPGLGRMRGPVLAYISVILAMALAAAGRSPWVFAGAVLFVTSDALIGLDRFWRPLPAGHLSVMVLYYAGQGAIVAGLTLG